MQTETLTLAAIVREPAETLASFVDWHVTQGATRIHLCFDDPEDPAIDGLQHRSEVIVTRATPGFWSDQIGIAPDAEFVHRQNAFLTYAYHAASKGWFGALDGDEYFYLSDGDLLDRLMSLDPETVCVTIRAAEHVQTPQDDDFYHFRLPQPRWLRQALYPGLSHVLKKREGLVGHRAGKSLTRTGLGPRVRMRQHWPHVVGRSRLDGRILTEEDGAYLLHFLDRGYENWRAKLPWRFASHGYSGGLKEVLAAAMAVPDAEVRLREIHAELHVFEADRLALLTGAGRSVSVPVPMLGRHAAGLQAAA